LPIEIIPNPVVARFWDAESQETTHKQDDDDAIIFTASTVVAPKGIGELVEAVAMVRSRGYRARLVIAGKWGRLGHALHRQLAADSELAGWLSLLGHVPRELLRENYRSADVVCFPSWWENCPCACLEAMAAGALVVGSSAGGMAEIIREGRDGHLVRARNSSDLAQRLMHVLSLPPAERQRLRDNARTRIETGFDADIIVPRMLACYEAAIESVRRTPGRRHCA
jgi:glycosyltransferase involved in cell wall biosynthesis